MAECKVSVCIPTFNYASFLPEAIESILSQRFTDFELLIIDDDSTDDTRSVVEGYARQDSRIVYRFNPRNVGMVGNWNLCLTHARGKYIKFVFGDDVLCSPDALERMVAVLDADSLISLVASARKIIDQRSRVLTVWSDFKKTGVWAGADVINLCLPGHKNFIGEPSVAMFRKEQAARGFLEKYRQIVDLEMWLHLLEQGNFAYIHEPLCSFRKHDQQQTVKNEQSFTDVDDSFNLMADYHHKDYVKMSGVMKWYEKYDGLYPIWKGYKKKRLSREATLEILNKHDLFATFMLGYPVYTVLKPLFKIRRKHLLKRVNLLVKE